MSYFPLALVGLRLGSYASRSRSIAPFPSSTVAALLGARLRPPWPATRAGCRPNSEDSEEA